MRPARTVFLGSGTFARPVLERLIEPDGAGSRGSASSARSPLSVVAVITAPPRPAGRHVALRVTPVAELAARHELPVMTPASLRDEGIIAGLRAIEPDLIVLADYGRMVPRTILDLPPHGALNLHPSLLPRHRGASPIPAAILAGDEVTGVSLMRMDEGLDSGPLLAQRQLALSGDETAPQLEALLAASAADLLLESLPAWLAGALPALPQATTGMTMTRPLRREDGRLDPRRPAVELERQVRAFQPWPGSFIEAGGERLIVWRATVEDDTPPWPAVPGPAESPGPAVSPGPAEPASSGWPGELEPFADTLALRTSSGLLRLDEVQPAGRRRMSGAELRRGWRPGRDRSTFTEGVAPAT